MVEFQEFRFHGGQGALRAGPLHAYVFGGVHEMPVQAGIADLSPAVHHGVGGTAEYNRAPCIPPVHGASSDTEHPESTA